MRDEGGGMNQTIFLFIPYPSALIPFFYPVYPVHPCLIPLLIARRLGHHLFLTACFIMSAISFKMVSSAPLLFAS